MQDPTVAAADREVQDLAQEEAAAKAAQAEAEAKAAAAAEAFKAERKFKCDYGCTPARKHGESGNHFG